MTTGWLLGPAPKVRRLLSGARIVQVSIDCVCAFALISLFFIYTFPLFLHLFINVIHISLLCQPFLSLLKRKKNIVIFIAIDQSIRLICPSRARRKGSQFFLSSNEKRKCSLSRFGDDNTGVGC